MKRLVIISCLILNISYLFAQVHTISGFVEDARSGEKLISANIYDSKTLKGTISNNYGFYSLTLPEGKIELIYSFVGYAPIKKQINLVKDTIINISLEPSVEIQEVTITDNRVLSKVKSTQMSRIEIPVETIKNLPVLLGEVDIIKTIQLLPGVQSGSEGASGLYVRGGGPDQNLVLLDGVPVYNVNHLFGFFSVFNADAINTVSLTKGGFPARYGGRLSSVLDIRMKEGNTKEIKGEGSVGIISSKLAIEGPIVKDKTSFIVSGRRTYIDILSYPIQYFMAKSEDIDKLRAGYYFYDVNAKINHKFSDKSRLYLSSYMGSDKVYALIKDKGYNYKEENNFKLRWGNITSALRWNYILNNKLFSNTTLTYSRFKFLTGLESIYEEDGKKDEFGIDYSSGIYDWAVKIDFDFMPNPNNYIRFGVNNTYHTFNPGINTFRVLSDNSDSDIDTTFGNKNIYANEFYLYVEDDIKLSSKIKSNIGLHYSNFSVKGKIYHSLEPRFSIRYLYNEKLSFKAAATKMTQYIHLLTNSTLNMPTDLWVPVTDTINPLRSWQYAAGAVYALTDKIDVSIEGFYKNMHNLIEYKEGASYFSAGDKWEDKIEIGKGWSYGAEFLVKKDLGKTTGWIGYTLSWSERKFENIGFGKTFPYKYDRRHDISVVVTHKFNDKVDVGLTWVYGTGNATTLGIERYVSLEGSLEGYLEAWDIEYFENRNGFRMPSYHRLDVGVNLHKEKKWGKRTWSFGLYNAYNRQNPFFLYFTHEYNNQNDQNKKVLKQLSLFPVIPSVCYKFEF